MLTHPEFSPIALALGPLKIHWYGLMYLCAFVMFVQLGKYRARTQPAANWQPPEMDDLLFYGALGVVLGGRLGYVLFYKLGYYLQHPLEVFYIWEGGMSFHGGFLGVLIALWWFGRKTGRHFINVADWVAPLCPLGLAAGRIGNFINGELWGRVTDPNAFWAMRFPQAQQADLLAARSNPQWAEWLQQYGALPRHPSQLYQIALEGLCLFAILWFYTRKPRPLGAASSLFFTGYGVFRFIAEFGREPDAYLGLLALNFSMGQWLSLPMIAIGIALWLWAHRRASVAAAN